MYVSDPSSEYNEDYIIKKEKQQPIHTLESLHKKLNGLTIDASLLPYIVATNVPLETYNSFISSEHRYPAMLEWKDERILLIELPTRAHEVAHEEINLTIMQHLRGEIESRGSTTTVSNHGGPNLQADKSYRPINVLPPQDGTTEENFVTVVIEVASSVPLADVQEKAQRWLTETSCREVIVIKMSKNFHKLLAFLYRYPHLNPVQSLNFGGHRCTGLGQRILRLSLISLFGGLAALVPPAIALQFPTLAIPIDLWPVKQAILRCRET